MTARVVTIVGFVLLGLVVVGLVIVGRRRPDLFSRLGSLFDRVMVTRSIRVTIVLFWFWLGWHFFVSP